MDVAKNGFLRNSPTGHTGQILTMDKKHACPIQPELSCGILTFSRGEDTNGVTGSGLLAEVIFTPIKPWETMLVFANIDLGNSQSDSIDAQTNLGILNILQKKET